MKRTIFLGLLIGVLIISCTKPKIIRELPEGNLTKISKINSPNTTKDEVAPVQRPSNLSLIDPCEKESSYTTSQSFDGIITSENFVRQIISVSEYNKEAIEYLTSNVESVTFLTSREGFASFSHPPSEKFIQRNNLPMSGSIGGTDIFYFYPKNEGVYFDVLPEPINSYFWDSHPFASNDALGNILIIWASDRKDNRGGFSFPYANQGNTDLYFAFKRPNQNWSEVTVQNFSFVNTDFSEASPFLFCKCYNPTLFFASNRNSKDSTFDIFYVNLEIDFINQKIFPKGKVEKLTAEQSLVNTSADERFPYVAYPHVSNSGRELKIYFTSNRYKDSVVSILKDTTQKEIRVETKNVGGYDLYQFNLDRNEFKCEPPPPPPPPKLFLVVRINEFYYDDTGKLLDSLIDINSDYFLNDISKRTKDTIELELARDYNIERKFAKPSSCDSCFSTSISLTTPNKIYKDTTIDLTLNTYCYKKPQNIISFSMQKGLAFFVTGYWYPTTTENLYELWRRSKSGCLKLSKFIDSTDFKPDSRYFYIAAATENDKWLNNVFYPKIDSLLQLLDTCYSNQKILITIHGYTDPCPLRTIRDESGRIIEDSTLYSCDEDIIFENIKIPTGTLMKKPNLRTIDGKPIVPPYGFQQGNYVLAMLRAYYTKETVIKGFKQLYANNPRILNLFDKYVRFSLNAFGIYDERPPCPEIDKDIVGVELANRPYPESLNEPCNLPHSRRAMIYLDVVFDEVLAKGFARDECGKLGYLAYTETKKVIRQIEQKAKTVITPPKQLAQKIDTIYQEPPLLEPPEGTPCFGICYRIVYGTARNESEFLLIKDLLKAIGFEVQDPEGVNLDLVSKEKFYTIEQAKKTIEEFKKAIHQLSGIIEISRIKAYVIQI